MNRRDPRERDRDYLSWVAHLPCAACMYRGVVNRRVQVAHLRAGSLEYEKRHTGKGEKPHDRWTLPLCQPHHTGDVRVTRHTQHDQDEVTFWAVMGINPFALCLALNRAYAQGLDGYAVIALAAARGRRTLEETTHG